MIAAVVIALSSLVGIGLTFDAGRQYQRRKDYAAQNCELAFDNYDLKIALESPAPPLVPLPDPERAILTEP